MAFKSGEAKFLSQSEERSLKQDILTRLDLCHVLAEHSASVLEAELGIASSTVSDMRHDTEGLTNHKSLSPVVVEEGRRRCALWCDAKRIMDKGYTVPLLAKKYGCSEGTIRARIREVKHELTAASTMARPKWTLTKERMEFLEACAERGMGITDAANDVGVNLSTLRGAARREGKSGWLNDLFDSTNDELGGYFHGMRTISIEELRQDQSWRPRGMVPATMRLRAGVAA